MNAHTALIVLILIWAGMVLGIFLQNLVIFRMPALKKLIATTLSHPSLKSFHIIQAVFIVAAIVISYQVHPPLLDWVELSMVILILAVQTFSLYPRLIQQVVNAVKHNKHIAMFFTHQAYGMLEVVKAVILVDIAVSVL